MALGASQEVVERHAKLLSADCLPTDWPVTAAVGTYVAVSTAFAFGGAAIATVPRRGDP